MSESLRAASLLCLLGLYTLVACVQAFNAPTILEAVCKDEEAQLNRISELRTIAELLDGGYRSLACNSTVIEAIRDLAQLAEHVGREGCSRLGPKLVATYKSQHYLREYLPRAVRRFFVALGFRLSESCRSYMTWNMDDAWRALRREDSQYLDGLLQGENLAATSRRKASEEVDIVTQLSRLTTRQSSTEPKIFIQVVPGNRFAKIKSVCVNRLKPVYKETVAPMLELWRLGFQYTKRQVQDSDLERRTGIRVWLRNVLLCMALEEVQIIESNEDLLSGQVKVLAQEQALRMQVDQERRKTPAAKTVTEQVYSYTGPKVRRAMEDLVMDARNSLLVRMVNKFDASRDAPEAPLSGVVQLLLYTARKALRDRQLIVSGSCARRKSNRLSDDQMAICEFEKLLLKEERPKVSRLEMVILILLSVAVLGAAASHG